MRNSLIFSIVVLSLSALNACSFSDEPYTSTYAQSNLMAPPQEFNDPFAPTTSGASQPIVNQPVVNAVPQQAPVQPVAQPPLIQTIVIPQTTPAPYPAMMPVMMPQQSFATPYAQQAPATAQPVTQTDANSVVIPDVYPSWARPIDQEATTSALPSNPDAPLTFRKPGVAGTVTCNPQDVLCIASYQQQGYVMSQEANVQMAGSKEVRASSDYPGEGRWKQSNNIPRW